MATEKVPMTLTGYDRLADEMKRLKSIERPAIIKAIAEARGHGDLSENAEYHAAREKQSFLEGRLAEIEDKLSRAEVIDVSKLSGDTVRFGAIVTLVDEDTDQESTYQIVGVDEADLEKGLISVSSPLARGLIGKSEGESVEVAAPSGPKAYEILKVRFK
jgi:transcription elongation factor GreA